MKEEEEEDEYIKRRDGRICHSDCYEVSTTYKNIELSRSTGVEETRRPGCPIPLLSNLTCSCRLLTMSRTRQDSFWLGVLLCSILGKLLCKKKMRPQKYEFRFPASFYIEHVLIERTPLLDVDRRAPISDSGGGGCCCGGGKDEDKCIEVMGRAAYCHTPVVLQKETGGGEGGGGGRGL